MTQDFLDKKNSEFWSEPCGTNAAIELNLHSKAKEDIEKFDSWYRSFYPYLFEFLDSFGIEGKSVLEVGIGYGTVSRYLGRRAHKLTLLDIAPGALNFVRSSFNFKENTEFLVGSILEFDNDRKFDLVVAIGSLHHTGDLEKALQVVENAVASQGYTLIMVYYAFQPRRWITHPARTFLEFIQTTFLSTKNVLIFEETDTHLRARADANQAGEAAPYTVFSSRKIFLNREGFNYTVSLNNFHRVPFFSRFLSRDFFLRNYSHKFGCDIYAVGKKCIEL